MRQAVDPGVFRTPRDGQLVSTPGRDSVSNIHLLGRFVAQFSADRGLVTEGNLSVHLSRETKLVLAAWPETRALFVPKHACWLNLIAPRWKQLRSLAPKGRRFESFDELAGARSTVLDYWQVQRCLGQWEKRLQEQVHFPGGFSFSHVAQVSAT